MDGRAAVASLIVALPLCASELSAETPAVVGRNLIRNGGFEQVRPDGIPTGWTNIEPPTGLTDRAHSGRRALRMVAEGDGSVVVNGFVEGAPAFGVIRFWYTIIASDSDGANIRMYAIAWKDGEAEPRAVWVAPKEHVGDGLWHQAALMYGFRTRPPAVIIAPRINEGGPAGKGEVLFDDVQLYRLAAALEVGEILSSRPALVAGEEFALKCTVRNVGGERLEDVGVEGSVDGALARSLTGGGPVGALEPGDEAEVVFRGVFDAARLARFTVVASAGGIRATRETWLAISRPFPGGPVGRSQAGAGVNGDAAWIGDDAIHLQTMRNPYGFGPAALYCRVRGGWHLVGVLAPLIAVVLEDDRGVTEPPLVPRHTVATGGRRPRLTLTGERATRDGARAAFEVAYELEPRAGRIRGRYRLRANRDVKVLAFRGPWLHAGERAFGAEKDSAIFGGLEYLTADERSSNYLYSAPPLDDRRVPHPYKITIPVMAVERRKLVVGLTWDPLQRWTDGHAYPSAYFAAPNRFAGQDNHAMGLFAPSVPEWVQENRLRAKTPYLLKRGRSMTITATIFAGLGESALSGMAHWFAAHPPPEPPQTPRSLDEELKVIGLPPPRPNIEVMLNGAAHGIAARLALQRPDGSWGYEQPDKARELFKTYGPMLAAREKALGIPGAFSPDAYARPGDSASGLQGWNLTAMLPYAMVTGNEAVLDACLKGLEFLDRCERPEGAQTWEVPLHAPDILASAQAVEAFLMAYRLTGDRRHLESAKRWARAGLPFTYFWNAEDRPVMRYGTIPIYGTSIFVVSWYGTLVQWCGMWYARALIHLSQFDDSFPWRRVGAGITACCMQQHMLEGEYENAYPDGWNVVTDSYGGVPIHPGDIHRNIHLLKGTFAEPDFRALVRDDVRVCINTESPIAGAGFEGDTLRLSLAPGPNEFARVTISSVAQFDSIAANGQTLREGAGRGAWWRRMPAYGSLLMLSVPGDRAAEVRLQGVRLTRVTDPPRPAEPTWTFDRAGDAEGWVATNDLAPLRVRDGHLICKAVGPDPFMTAPDVAVDASERHVLRVRVRAESDAAVQVYWGRLFNGQVSGFNDEDHTEFAVRGDDRFHDYAVDLAENDGWRGHIIAFRLDPGGAGSGMAFDRVELTRH